MIRYAYWNWGDFQNDELLREGIDDAYWQGYTAGSPNRKGDPN